MKLHDPCNNVHGMFSLQNYVQFIINAFTMFVANYIF